jgi:2-keto-4-pentenoate hydratase/2-oxohepta-3-ene-1,7-dioic acid hydratase in catechol pathway
VTETDSFQLGTFSAAGCRPFPGLVIGERVIALQALQPLIGMTAPRISQCATLLEVLDDWSWHFGALRDIAAGLAKDRSTQLSARFRPVSELAVHAPIPQPRTIYCSGANYKKHVVDLIVAHQEQPETQGMSLEQKRVWGMKLMNERAANGTPFIFIKPQSAVTGPFDPILVPRDAKKPDWELELAVVIGRRARRIPRDRALDYVAGYTVVNDITLREKVFRRKTDSPELGMDFTVSKGAPSFLPMGPYLAPASFVGDPQQLRITLKLNGDVMQDESTSDMIFTVAHLIEYLSASVELQPGDLICTGSPAGNGMHYGRFIQNGDVLEGSITGPLLGLGTQRNSCIVEQS